MPAPFCGGAGLVGARAGNNRNSVIYLIHLSRLFIDGFSIVGFLPLFEGGAAASSRGGAALPARFFYTGGGLARV